MHSLLNQIQASFSLDKLVFLAGDKLTEAFKFELDTCSLTAPVGTVENALLADRDGSVAVTTPTVVDKADVEDDEVVADDEVEDSAIIIDGFCSIF